VYVLTYSSHHTYVYFSKQPVLKAQERDVGMGGNRVITSGQLSVTVHRCGNLVIADSKSSDPYVKVRVGDQVGSITHMLPSVNHFCLPCLCYLTHT
jgi:Ca2+-dependent lipid-binding protein